MASAPTITLTATFQDMTGAAIGSASNPCRMRIDLCGFGQTIPVVPGSGVVAQIEKELTSTNGFFTNSLYGNDVITPSGTFYQITVIDAKDRVIQSGMYQFTGTETIDLSNAEQIVNPSLNPPIANQVGYEYQFTAAGTTFNLPSAPAAGTQVQLWWEGAFQGFNNGRNFTVSGATVTLNFTAQTGDYVDVLYYQS